MGTLPCSYLGIPFFIGNNLDTFWEIICKLIMDRISLWKHKWLSFVGKIQMVKFVLNAIPIYMMSVLKAPCHTLNQLKSTLRSFLCNDNVGGKEKIPLIAWDNVCLPKDIGGIGIRNLKLQNVGLGAKLTWKLYQNPHSRWGKLMFSKYFYSHP